MKVLFMGSGDISVPTLQWLANHCKVGTLMSPLPIKRTFIAAVA